MTRWPLRLCALCVAAVFIVIAVVPMVCAVWTSIHGGAGFTLDAYRAVLREPRQWGLLRNTLLVACGTACAATVLGVGMAFALEYVRVPGRRILAYGTALPFLIPPYIMAIAWIEVFGANGLLQQAAGRLGYEGAPVNLNGLGGVIFVSAMSCYPVAALTAGLALRRYDRRMTEAARLAVSPWRTLTGVVLPLLGPSIATGVLIVFLLSLVGFAVPSLLQVNVYPVEVFTSFSAFYDFRAATAQSLPMIVIGLTAVGLGAIYIAPRKAWLTGAARTGSAMRASRPVRITATAFAWTLAAVSGAVPMAVLVWRSLPLRSYSEVFATAKTEIVTSILLAALTATIVTSLAFVLAYLNRLHHQTARRDIPPHPLQRGSWFVSSLLALRHASLLAFLASGPVLGTALILTWNRPGPPAWIYDTVLVVLLACSARYLFFAQYACENTLRDVDVQLDEAARMAGAPWWRVFSGILLPVSWPALAGVWGLAFILAMGEIDATALVCPPGVTPLSGRIFSLMHYGPSRLVAALSVTTVCIILACAAATAGLYAKGKRVRDAQR